MKSTLLVIPLLAVVVLAGGPVEPTLELRTAMSKALKEGRKTVAFEVLKTLVGFPGGIFPFDAPSILAAFKEDPAFKELERRYERDYPRIVSSQLAFSVTAPDLVPEGLAFDPVERMLYLGSMPSHTILRLTLDGKATTFVPPGQDGLGEVIGIRVDAGRRTLWAASLSTTETSVLAFDLGTGRLLRKATLPREGHLLNDLVVTPDGDVVVTDSDGSTLYRLGAGRNALEALPVAVKWPNGIALSPDGSTLFVAEVETGILRVDLASGQATALKRPARLSLLGIDGLYARERELIAIHNWQFACQVVRYRTNAEGTKVERVDVLERRDPRFKLPTTGAIVDQWFYFMANPQVDRFSSGTIEPGPPLEPIHILRTRL